MTPKQIEHQVENYLQDIIIMIEQEGGELEPFFIEQMRQVLWGMATREAAEKSRKRSSIRQFSC